MELSVSLPTSQVSSRPARSVCLLLEKDPVIAADIAGALEETGNCHVIHITCADRVGEVLLNTPHLDAAFLEMTLHEILESNLEATFILRPAIIVLTKGEDNQDRIEARGWHLLNRPFTDQMLREKIRELGIQQCDTPGAG